MKVLIHIEAMLNISLKDLPALENAGPVELIQTAVMQSAEVNTKVEPIRRTKKQKVETEPEVTKPIIDPELDT